MFEKIATLVGYTKAPRTTFFLKHPRKAAKTLLTWKGAKSVARSPVAAALGAAVAVPLTVLAVRRLRQGN